MNGSPSEPGDPPATPGHVWVDGRILPADGPHLSVFDRGFQLGDGVFETLRASAGRPTELDQHLARLHRSAAGLDIALPDDVDRRLAAGIDALLAAEGLEPVRRGPYTGALGWIGPDGAMQTSILIRTFVADGRRLTLHVGGGITWHSDPAAEWDETVAKARGPLGAIGGEEAA